MFQHKPSTEELLNCEYVAQCGGCQIASMNKSEQLEFKKNHFAELWKKAFNEAPTLEFVRPTESGFRNRADLTIQKDNLTGSQDNIEYQRIGFYKKDSRDILDIEACPLMTGPLQKFYSEIRKINFPVQKGSLRIRVSPSGKKGLWIDFANEDIKKLLDEKIILTNLLKICDVIEIGQKRKRLTHANEQLRLIDPQTEEWFETYDQNLNPIPLEMNVGSFSQTGFKTNKELISQLFKILKNCSKDNVENSFKVSDRSDNGTWLELCSGSGNLTFPLLSIFSKVIATELDENSVKSLKSTAEKLNLSEKLQVEKINIHKSSERLAELLSNIDGILADPPRSGLQGFLEVISDIPKKNLPKNFVYVSCFAETLISDSKTLRDLGYKTQKIMGVDQFPHSTHCEWIVHLNIY